MTGEAAPIGSIARAARVLEALAAHPDGAPLADLVAATGFTKTTVHRTLAAMQDVAWVHQDPQTRAYALGTRLGDLARQAGTVNLAAMARRGMQRLAEVTADTVFLSVPEGAAALCVAREVGAYPIRTLTLDRGDRRPLGVGAGALALYAAMPSEARAAACRINRLWLQDYGFDTARLEEGQRHFANQGYALNDGGVVAAMSAVGVPVITRNGRLAAALAVGAIRERMTAERIAEVILPALRTEAAHLAERLSDWDEEMQA
ncbi:IclR family transcriptional regulator [Rhodobacteraceae bacterium CCMM004]|nr:IclR family transcriptional regulator [Rhodobacteraceae bacterium CCMM004]